MINKRRPWKKTADDSVTLAQPNAKRSRWQPGAAPLGCLLPTVLLSHPPPAHCPPVLRRFTFPLSNFLTFNLFVSYSFYTLC